MFNNGDIVKIRKEYLGPNESDRLYRVVNTNPVTRHSYIEPVHTKLPLSSRTCFLRYDRAFWRECR